MDNERVDTMQPDMWQFWIPQQNGSMYTNSCRSSSRRGPRAETMPWQETEKQTAMQTAQVSDAMGH